MMESAKPQGFWRDYLARSAELTGHALTGPAKLVLVLVAIFFAAFYVYTAGPSFLGRVGVGTYRGLFLLLSVSMVFLLSRARSGTDRPSPRLLDWALIALPNGPLGFCFVTFPSHVPAPGPTPPPRFLV